MRTLAIDLGDKRTGLALGDPVTGIAAPLTLIETPITDHDGEALLAKLAAAIDEHTDARDTLLIGLPLNMDGTEGPRAALTRAFAARLTERTGREILFVDERKTSQLADARLAHGCALSPKLEPGQTITIPGEGGVDDLSVTVRAIVHAMTRREDDRVAVYRNYFEAQPADAPYAAG